MISKQIALGLVLLIGGTVTLFALLQHDQSTKVPIENSAVRITQDHVIQDRMVDSMDVPLTTDIATEKKILAQKQKEREAYHQKMTEEAEELLKEQEQARILALDKAKQENIRTTGTQISADNAAKSELIAVPKKVGVASLVEEQKHLFEQKLSDEKPKKEQYKGQDRSKDIQKKINTNESIVEDDSNKSDGRVGKAQKSTGAIYSVQVALSPDKQKVDAIVTKYRAAGYSVGTSQTSRGIRVLIGSAKSYDEANGLRQKIAQDSRVDSDGAWVKKMQQ